MLAKGAAVKYSEEMRYDLNCEEYKFRQPLVQDKRQISETELMEFHEPRVKELLESSVDLLTFESILNWKEVQVILNLLKKYPQTRAMISLLCSLDKKLKQDGYKFVHVAERCYNTLPNQIIAIGAECIASEIISPLMRFIKLSRNPQIPFMLYADKSHLFNEGNTVEF
ncbi:PREDICTED: homocysteine S-methyltransferase YbgG-like [Dinoponera quadriceps]|uniref:Homocysteine S-methyltransferase YbgG-like n=1 Tax=Dinoponera quadriceps TaxID=609295 RepID=A0A6P3WY60_DINQU|nr:PREDICTED: homocysteine S-methyltransferase YbgG-like [Dinoponera quadriceps]